MVVHRISEKLHEVSGGMAVDSISTGDAGKSSPTGNPCRYLSRQVVGRYVGIEIVATQAEGDSCSYLAKGNQGDMAAKHAAKLLGARGADEKTQTMIRDFAGGLFRSMPQEKQDAAPMLPAVSQSCLSWFRTRSAPGLRWN